MTDFTNGVRVAVPRWVRNFSRAPIKALRHTMRSLSYALNKKAEICEIRPDWTLSCHPNSYVLFSLYREVPELKTEMDEFVQYAEPGMKFLDIGAHYGLFTLAAVRYGGAGTRVISVDPSPETHEVLNANLSLNDIQGNVRTVQAAVGESEQKLQMLTTGAFGEFMFMARPDRPDTISVDCTTIPSLAESFSLPFTHIKIDVEGYETEVIKGGQNYLKNYKPIIFLEIHLKIMRSMGKNPRAVLDLLRETGYECLYRGRPIEPDWEFPGEDIIRVVCVSKLKGLSQ